MLSQPWAKRTALRRPRCRPEARRIPGDAGRHSPYTALTNHRLGVIAQTLEHWEAAARCYAEALKIGVELKGYLLCGQSCHQLSEVRQAQDRLDEAIAWSVLAFAMLDMVPERRARGEVSKLVDLAERVSMAALEDVWLSVTGEHLPIELRQSAQRLLGCTCP